MLNFQNVTKEYKLDASTTITPVRDLSLAIKSGELIVIVGRSGTGKTTLLNLAAGLVRPTNGTVRLKEHDLSRMTDRDISSLRSRQIGFVFQFPSLLPSLTIKENVALPAIFCNGNKKDSGGKSEELLSSLGLSSKCGVYPRQLSAGEQKRAIIARSLINDPGLVLADEPTSDLDGKTEEEVMNLLREINSRGVTFLIVTHSLELINFAHRAFEMERGVLKSVK